ncbi:MAG: hypothetical protein M3Y56_05485 [Armatimonadota bacterium]|nr:hypothetical protein [Armatimonadota bacterium]
MPTYEYLCKSCNHRFDLVQKISDPPPAACPECEGGPIQKVFTSVGVIFKGAGFHINDYRKPESKSESDSKDGEKSSPKDDTKTDSTKEAATGESKTETPAAKPDSPATPAASTPAPSTSAKDL